jgi:hypothetical protein
MFVRYQNTSIRRLFLCSFNKCPGAGKVDQAVHPSGVGKLVAVSKKWVTAAEELYSLGFPHQNKMKISNLAHHSNKN